MVFSPQSAPPGMIILQRDIGLLKRILFGWLRCHKFLLANNYSSKSRPRRHYAVTSTYCVIFHLLGFSNKSLFTFAFIWLRLWVMTETRDHILSAVVDSMLSTLYGSDLSELRMGPWKHSLRTRYTHVKPWRGASRRPNLFSISLRWPAYRSCSLFARHVVSLTFEPPTRCVHSRERSRSLPPLSQIKM